MTPDEIQALPFAREMRVVSMVRTLYGIPACGVGGPLHIVTDDYNLETHHIVWCLEHLDEWLERWADPPMTEPERALVIMLAGSLLAISEEHDRWRLIALASATHHPVMARDWAAEWRRMDEV